MSHNSYKNDMSSDERVMMAIVRAAERFKKESSVIFKRCGLSFPQYNVLRVLDASKDGRNTIKDVNQIMLVSGANMTGITKRLEKMGCIVRSTDQNDERLKWLEITEKGRQILSCVANEKDQVLRKYLKSYSNKEKSEMLTILGSILHSE